MRHYYCSTFSKDYVFKGLLLYDSLEKCDKDFHFFMICLNEEVKMLLEKMNLYNATLITLSEVEQEDEELLRVKSLRSVKEYAWTSKASVCLYLFNNFEEIDHITWLDGDTFFFSDPDPIFAEWGEYSIMLTEERWRERDKELGETNGIYNTGFMGFKRDEYGLECLSWFREKLIDWCYDKWEMGLWSDQVYVNDWPERFKNVGIIRNMGVNVTPYIIQGCDVTRENSDIYIDNDKLIFFHYYGFKYYDGNEFDLCSYKMSYKDNVLKWIYMPYIYKSREIIGWIQKIDSAFYKIRRTKDCLITNYFNLSVNEARDKNRYNLCTILTREYLIKGLILYNSLKKSSPEFHLWVCCMDDTTYNLLNIMKLDNVTLIDLKCIEDYKLINIKYTRSLSEYCWTLKAPFILYLMKNNFNLRSLIYTDADMFFFEDIKELYKEWGNDSIFICKQLLSAGGEKKYGIYEAGLIGFNRDKNAFKCLYWWKKKCIKWCYDKFQKNCWSDQKYLDSWPQLFSKVKILEDVGVDAGPWNIKRHKLYKDKDTIRCDDYKLSSYHFSGITIFNEWEFDLCRTNKLTDYVIECLYKPYINEIQQTINYVKLLDSSFDYGIFRMKDTDKCLNYFKAEDIPD